MFWRNTEGEYLRDFRGCGGNGRLLAIGVYVGDDGDEHEKVLSYVTPTQAGAATTPTTDWVVLHDLGVAVPCAPDGNHGDVCAIPPYKSWRLRSDLDTLVAPSCPWLRLVFEMPSGVVEQEVVSYDRLAYTHRTMPTSSAGDEEHAIYSVEEFTSDHLITHRSHPGLVASVAMLRAAEKAESLAKKAASVAGVARSRFMNVTLPELVSSAEQNVLIFGEGTAGMLQATIQVRKVADRLALAESLSRDAAGEAARLTELYGTAADKFIEDIE
jgi:hypothetical protein